MPRYSNDPKETTLKLRLNEEMRTYIENSAKRKGISMSEYLRQMIFKDMKRGIS
jgi:predicted HicB family RNase H-like nuclease